MISQINLLELHLMKAIPLILKPRFWIRIYPFKMILFLTNFTMNVTILISKLSISHFKMVIYLVLHLMVFIFSTHPICWKI